MQYELLCGEYLGWFVTKRGIERHSSKNLPCQSASRLKFGQLLEEDYESVKDCNEANTLPAG